MNYCSKFIFLLLLFYAGNALSQTTAAFKVIPLGVKGGIDESNLSGYLLAAAGSSDYICLDAGTLHDGIQKAVDAGLFKETAAEVLKKDIKGYCISHAHLDHVAGLIMNSPEDSSKNIYGLPFCLDILKEKYFTWKSWANFANEGDKPALGKYHYSVLSPGVEAVLDHTGMNVTAFPLSHSNPYQSTAFLIRHEGDYLLYLGDTGADTIEKANNLHLLWQAVSTLIKTKKLKAIFIEVSFPDEQPEKQLFGHLTPRLLMTEMVALSELTGKDALSGLTVAITHIKPNGNNEAKIRQELTENNKLELRLVFPEQSKLYNF